jgi:uncharacterized protein YgfB (UPF0149 family)
MTPSLPTYTEVTNALKSTEMPFQAAQVHGYICGLLCATHGKIDNSWQNAVLGDKKNRNAREMLQQLFETSYHLISEFSFEFLLILPADRSDINVRTEALSSWCQGFLTGLKQCHVPIENRNPSDVTETLNDFIEIAKVNYGDMNANEEDETAYFELVEYVRLGVLMIFHELNTPAAEEETDDKLH